MVARLSDVAQLLHGIAAILWPIVVLVLVVLFRTQLAQLLGRIRKWRGFGQEVDLDKSLDSLQRDADEATQQLPVQPVVVAGSPDAAAREGLAAPALGVVVPPSDASLPLTDRAPEAALILVARDIEVELRTLAASMGLVADGRTQSVPRLVEALAQPGIVPAELASAIREFWNVRNRVIHGYYSERPALRALDIGVGLLDAIRSIPHEQNFVYNPGVEVYADQNGATQRPNVLALVLRTVSTDGPETRRVFPTTRTNYEVGQRLSWEWNNDLTWGESWYRNPDTGELEYAWTGSLEFVGRPIESIL